MTGRIRHRPDDPWPVRMASFVLRWRGLATLVWMGVAAISTGLVLAWRFSPRLNAQETFEARSILTDEMQQKQIDSLYVGMHLVTKSACMDRTKKEQQWAGMTCPDSLYKGASP